MARPLNKEETPILKKAQADLAQAKRSLSDTIDGLNTLVSRWQSSGDLDAMDGAILTRSDLQECLAALGRAHALAGKRLRDNFDDGAIVVQSGGGR